MRGLANIALLAALPAVLGQFGPLTTTSSSAASAAVGGVTSTTATPTTTSDIPAPPSESTGCSLHGDHYHCEGPAAGYEPTSLSSGALSPPTESVGCSLHGDHYHCEGPAPGYTPTATGAEPSAPSPTESPYCMAHEDHWDCFDTSAELQEAQSSTDTGECIIHVGHTHGDCSAEQLACGLILLEDYNMPLHIAALFIILVTSGLGVLLPIISAWFRKQRPEDAASVNHNSSADFGKGVGLWGNVFFIARHFGTGIILSTAFIHLLFHGFVMFQNECVGEMSYEATAPAISLAAAFITFLFDLVGARVVHAAHGPGHEGHGSDNEGSPLSREKTAPSSPGTPDESGPSNSTDRHPHPHLMDDGHGHHVDVMFAAEQNWQVLLLEAGILFHSIMIGVTLGAGSGNGWTTLFIVIIFHQIFEGLALGARIAVLTWISKIRSLLMAAAFTLITPIGIGIGIGVRKSFSQNGKASLLSVGILNSISAGILLYTAFKLLSADFTEGPLRNAKPLKVFVALASLVVGLIAMSVLGKWA